MKRFFKKGLILLLLSALVTACAEGAVFSVPSTIKVIESEAFDGMPFDEVYIPSGVTQIGNNAFSANVKTIYSFTGSAAEAYANENGIDFIPVDISDVYIDAAPFVSPFREFEAEVCYECYFDAEVTVSLMKDGVVICTASSEDGHRVLLRADEGGLYDLNVAINCGRFSREFFFEDEVKVYEPVHLISDRIVMAPGDELCPIDETELRTVKSITSSGNGIVVNGITVKALQNGLYTLTCVVDQDGEDVYTEFEVLVTDRAQDILTGETELILPVGETFMLAPAVVPEGSGDGVITYVSDDPSVATVDDSGLVTAVSQGETFIRISTFGAEVLLPVRATIPVESVTIIAPFDTLSMLTGTRNKLYHEVAPAEADNVFVYWTSSDESVVKVDCATGLVTAAAAGEAVITAMSEDGSGAVDTIRIAVRQGIDSIELNAQQKMTVGETQQVSTSYSPSNAVSTELIFESSDPSVLTVSEDGILHAAGAGRAVLTVRADNGTYAEKEIAVFEEASALSAAVSTLSVGIGKTFDLCPLLRIAPETVDVSGIRYASSDNGVASVSEDGIITGNAAGSAVISVSIDGISTAVPVNVTAPVSDKIAFISSYLVMRDGETASLQVSKPVSAYYTDSPEILDLSMPDIHYLMFRAKAPGNANVYVVSASGNITSAEIQVNPIVIRSIDLSESAITLAPGEEMRLNASVMPAGASEHTLSWISTDESVCEVSDGTVLAVGAGKASVFALSPSGVSAECAVTVTGIPMQEACLASDTVTVFAGESFDIEYDFEPADATPAHFDWVPDCGVCTVSGSSVTAISGGTCVITGTATDGSGITLTLTVYVEEIPLRELSVSTDSLMLTAGEQAHIDYSVYPYNACYGQAVFASADESVASVDMNGTVTAISAGTCDILVTAGYGAYEKTQTVTVNVQSASSVRYRALIMGQFTVPGMSNYLPFSVNGTTSVRSALSRSSVDGETYETTYLGASPSRETVHSAITRLAAVADEDDVTVLYLLAHGHYNKTDGYYMSTTSGSNIKGTALITAVSQIPGHVVLVICSCNSGEIFRCANLQTIMNCGGAYNTSRGTGRLSVICSTTESSSSFYNVDDPAISYDFFTRAFDQGIGWNIVSGSPMSMLADGNSNGSVTLGELTSFIPYRTQYLISSFRQIYENMNFWGNVTQYPKFFIASGDKELKIVSIKR